MITSPHAASSVELLQRIREEYREMPSLRLTPSQATRLFGLEASVCAKLLEEARERALSVTDSRRFIGAIDPRSSPHVRRSTGSAKSVVVDLASRPGGPRQDPMNHRAMLLGIRRLVTLHDER